MQQSVEQTIVEYENIRMKLGFMDGCFMNNMVHPLPGWTTMLFDKFWGPFVAALSTIGAPLSTLPLSFLSSRKMCDFKYCCIILEIPHISILNKI